MRIVYAEIIIARYCTVTQIIIARYGTVAQIIIAHWYCYTDERCLARPDRNRTVLVCIARGSVAGSTGPPNSCTN